MAGSQIVSATSPMFDLGDLGGNPNTNWAAASCFSLPPGSQAPLFCQFPGFNSTNSGTLYYTNSSDEPVFFWGPFRGNSFDLLAGMSSPQPDCTLLAFSTAIDGSRQNVPVSSSPLNSQETSLHISIKDFQCDSTVCNLRFSLQNCAINASNPFFLGGISIPIEFADSTQFCDHMIDFGPNPSVWDPQPSPADTSNTAPQDCQPDQSSPGTHTTQALGASAKITFNGTAIALLGGIQDTQYTVIVDENISLGKFSRTSTPSTSEVLFFISGLDSNITHSLNILNTRKDGVTAGTLVMNSFRVFGSLESENSSPTGRPQATKKMPVMKGVIAGSVVGILLVMAAILIVWRCRKRNNQRKLVAVYDRLEAPIPTSGPVQRRPIVTEKSDLQSHNSITENLAATARSDTEMQQETRRIIDGFVANSALMAAPGNRNTDNHTRASLITLQRVIQSILGGGLTEEAPPSYVSEADRSSNRSFNNSRPWSSGVWESSQSDTVIGESTGASSPNNVRI